MPFQKGNKLGGRKQGSVNKITQKVREAFLNILESNLDRIQSDLDALEPKDRLKILLELKNYYVPKLKTIEMNKITDNEPQQPVVITFTEAKTTDKSLRENY